MWLEAPAQETDERGNTHRTIRNKDQGRGTPQGAPISPALSNLYMRRFVLGWKALGHERRLDGHIVNYADDLVICCRGNATEALSEMTGRENADIAGSDSVGRGAESIIVTSGNQTAVINVTASNVVINGLVLGGDDPAITGGTTYRGADVTVTYGVKVASGVTGITLENSIIQHTAIGFRGDGLSTGNTIARNLFTQIGNYDFGYAITQRRDYYADITDNVMTQVWTGIHLNNFHVAGGPATWTISGNDIHAYAGGIISWLRYGSATDLTILAGAWQTSSPAATSTSETVPTNSIQAAPVAATESTSSTVVATAAAPSTSVATTDAIISPVSVSTNAVVVAATTANVVITTAANPVEITTVIGAPTVTKSSTVMAVPTTATTTTSNTGRTTSTVVSTDTNSVDSVDNPETAAMRRRLKITQSLKRKWS